MHNIKESISNCNKENLLKYHIFLSQARLMADAVGLRLVEAELKRVRGKYTFFESLDEQGFV